MIRSDVGDRCDRSGQLLAERYRIEQLIGVGAAGTVWSVRDRDSGLEAVAKVHEAALADVSDELAHECFIREVQALAAVRHPNVVSLFEVGRTPEGEPFLIMERLVGEPLDERLWRGRLTVSEAVGIADELLAGLEAVHGAGVLHRDVKPENVFLARAHGGTLVKLLDFGLSRGLGLCSGKITRAGAAVGTPGYMSPEQARGHRDLDVRTDLYSVGIVLYEMLSARRPFEGLTPTDIMVRSCTEPPVPLAQYRPDLASVLTEVVMRALSRDREDRFESAAAMRRAHGAAARRMREQDLRDTQSEIERHA